MASNMANTTTTPSFSTAPTQSRVLKRKAATENDLFKPCKRVNYSSNASPFAQEHQKVQQKVRDELPMREDMLRGIIVPRKFVPKDIHSSHKGRSTSDDTRTYRWASLNADKARVRKAKHVSEDVKARANQSFPKLEAKKKDEREAKLLQEAGWRKERDDMVDWWRNEVKEEKELKVDNTAGLHRAEFMYQCWKNFNYAASYQGGKFEHRDLNKWDKQFVS